MKTFQAILLAIFGFFIIIGVAAIATFGKFGGSGGEVVPAAGTIWGTLDATLVSEVLTLYNQDTDNLLSGVTYKQISEATFDTELIEALAAQRGPDAIILPSDFIMRYEDKIYPIPFTSVPERTFRDTFAEGSEIYLNDEGILAMPILVDPLVMYWNRSLFNAGGFSRPPSAWDELVTLSETLTKSDASFSILQSTIALGGYENITNAKEVLATLVMQAGTPITVRVPEQGVDSLLSDRLGFAEVPADSAIRFYTEFANPVKPVYSWNRALPSSYDMFLRGDLALYLGFGSELFDLQEKNPNLNFDVTRVPQVPDGPTKSTFGRFYGIALMKQSDDVAGAFQAAFALSNAQAGQLWTDKFALAPVRRDLLANKPVDAYKSVFYSEALIAHGFLDPNPAETDNIFSQMVSDITSGRRSVGQAVGEADTRLQKLVD